MQKLSCSRHTPHTLTQTHTRLTRRARVGRAVAHSHDTCRICTDNSSGATAAFTLHRPLLAITLHTSHYRRTVALPLTTPIRLQLHFILAKVMPMTTPAARAAAAMASTPEDGIMDGDLGQEESHAHLGAQRQGHRRRLDWHLSAATALFGIQAAGPSSRAQKQPRASGWAVRCPNGPRCEGIDHAATPARGAAARAVVALARWPTRAPGAGLGGAPATSAAALAGGAAAVAVRASACWSAGARHL